MPALLTEAVHLSHFAHKMRKVLRRFQLSRLTSAVFRKIIPCWKLAKPSLTQLTVMLKSVDCETQVTTTLSEQDA